MRILCVFLSSLPLTTLAMPCNSGNITILHFRYADIPPHSILCAASLTTLDSCGFHHMTLLGIPALFRPQYVIALQTSLSRFSVKRRIAFLNRPRTATGLPQHQSLFTDSLARSIMLLKQMVHAQMHRCICLTAQHCLTIEV